MTNCTGYEVSRQHDVTTHGDAASGTPWRSTAAHVTPSARRPESLATRREAVELLSCDAPLLAYLVQNGAISHLDVELTEREAASSARQNITLLRCVDRGGRAGLALLLNALRLTGQHQLANLLDYTPRIVPPSSGVEPASCIPGESERATAFNWLLFVIEAAEKLWVAFHEIYGMNKLWTMQELTIFWNYFTCTHAHAAAGRLQQCRCQCGVAEVCAMLSDL